MSFGQIELGARVELKYTSEVMLKVARGDGADEAALSIVRRRLGLGLELQEHELEEDVFHPIQRWCTEVRINTRDKLVSVKSMCRGIPL